MWTYPSSDLDRGRRLLGLLGSFWANTYDGRELVQKLLEARAEVEQQNWLTLMEAVRAFSRYEVPIFHTANWHLHVIAQGAATAELTWAAPPLLAEAPAIYNRLADPSVALTGGTDFTLEDGSLVFREDPFANPLWGTRPVFVDGEQTDTELFLWVFRGSFDFNLVYEHWGYVLGLALDSSEAYRDLLNAVFDALAGGTGLEQLQLAFAAMTGLPLAKAGETVQEVVEDATAVIVVTDQSAHRLPLGTTPTVAVGETLVAGQTLSDGLQFAELNRGETPSWATALVVGRGLLVGKFHSDLVFQNADLPLAVSADEDGYTRVEFPIGGFPLDVEEFWDKVHYQGRARGTTLAELLDTRPRPVSAQPDVESLPATVNPVKFLVENVLRNNCVLVRVRMAGLAAGAIGLHPARLLRKVVPPGTCVLVLIEVSPKETSVILDDSPGADAPGGVTVLGSFAGASPVTGEIGLSAVSTRVSAWRVSGTCQ